MNRILLATLVAIISVTFSALAQPTGNTSPSTERCTGHYSFLSTAAVQAAEIKGSAGTVCDIECFNKGAAAVYMRVYNMTGSPGTGDAANIVWRGIIPGSSTGAGYVVPFPLGRYLITGIGIRVSGAIADNDSTSLSANEVICNVGYK